MRAASVLGLLLLASVAVAQVEKEFPNTTFILDGVSYRCIPFSKLPTKAKDGTQRCCKDCTATNPCAGGGASPVMAFRSSGAWNCGGTGGGGGGSPAGPVNSVQLNGGGSTFAGDTDFTWNPTTNVGVMNGTLTTKLQDKGGSLYDARNYGAVCDGSNDDTTALNTMVALTPASACGYIPATPNGCKITDALTLPRNACLIAGPGAKLIASTNSQTILKITGSNVQVRDLFLTKAAGVTGVVGIWVNPNHNRQVNYGQFWNVRIEGVSPSDLMAKAVYVQGGMTAACAGEDSCSDASCSGSGDCGTWYNDLRKIRIRYALEGVQLDGTAASLANGANGTFVQGLRVGDSTTGFRITRADTAMVHGAAFEGITGTAIVIEDSAGADNNDSQFAGLRFEANTQDIFVGASSFSNSFESGVFTTAKTNFGSTESYFIGGALLRLPRILYSDTTDRIDLTAVNGLTSTGPATVGGNLTVGGANVRLGSAGTSFNIRRPDDAGTVAQFDQAINGWKFFGRFDLMNSPGSQTNISVNDANGYFDCREQAGAGTPVAGMERCRCTTTGICCTDSGGTERCFGGGGGGTGTINSGADRAVPVYIGASTTIDDSTMTVAASGQATATVSSANSVDAFKANATLTSDAGGADIVSGLHVTASSSSSNAGDSLYGIQVDATTGTAADESALSLGSGWDRDIDAFEPVRVQTTDKTAVQIIATNNANLTHGMSVALTQVDDTDATDTNSGVSVTATSSSTDADTLNAYRAENLTPGVAVERAFSAGTGWDKGFYSQSPLNEFKGTNAELALNGDESPDVTVALRERSGLFEIRQGDFGGAGNYGQPHLIFDFNRASNIPGFWLGYSNNIGAPGFHPDGTNAGYLIQLDPGGNLINGGPRLGVMHGDDDARMILGDAGYHATSTDRRATFATWSIGSGTLRQPNVSIGSNQWGNPGPAFSIRRQTNGSTTSPVTAPTATAISTSGGNTCRLAAGNYYVAYSLMDINRQGVTRPSTMSTVVTLASPGGIHIVTPALTFGNSTVLNIYADVVNSRMLWQGHMPTSSCSAGVCTFDLCCDAAHATGGGSFPIQCTQAGTGSPIGGCAGPTCGFYTGSGGYENNTTDFGLFSVNGVITDRCSATPTHQCTSDPDCAQATGFCPECLTGETCIKQPIMSVNQVSGAANAAPYAEFGTEGSTVKKASIDNDGRFITSSGVTATGDIATGGTFISSIATAVGPPMLCSSDLPMLGCRAAKANDLECTNCVTLGTETIGDYVAGITCGPLMVGCPISGVGGTGSLGVDTTADVTWTGVWTFAHRILFASQQAVAGGEYAQVANNDGGNKPTPADGSLMIYDDDTTATDSWVYSAGTALEHLPANNGGYVVDATSAPAAGKILVGASSGASVWQEKPLTSFVGTGQAQLTATQNTFDFLQINGRGVSGTEASVAQVVSAAWVVTKIICAIDAAPGASASRGCTLRKNGADTALTCTFGAAATTCSDTDAGITFVAGDRIDIKDDCFAGSACAAAGMGVTTVYTIAGL